MTKKKETPIKSMLWSILGRYLPSLIQIVSTIIIARLVTPAEFGEVALITVFIQIANLLISSGFAEALIFKGNNTNTLYSSVFFLNIFISIFLYALLFLFSSTIAEFYSIERLELLTKVVGLNIIVYSFTYIHRVLYMINQDFKTPAMVVLLSSFIGSITGIILAYNNYGVWALVCQTLLINIVQLLLFWKINHWKPNLVFSKTEIMEIIPYSSKILFNNIVQVLYDNVYTLVIGKVFSSKVLGYYNRMQTLVFFTTTNFMYAIESVFYPMLCKKKEDINHIKESYEILMRISTFIAFPILVILISLGKFIIIILLSEKWLGSLQILKLISIAYLFIPIIYMNNSFLKIINKPNVLFYTGVVKKIIGMLILFLTINYDIEFVMYGIILYSVIDSIISMVVIHLLMKVSVFKQVYFMLNNIILNTILFFVLTYVSSFMTGAFMKVLISLIVGVMVYITIPVFLKMKEFQIFNKIILKKR
ncbi:lipopolysaccharide biosynthesis protein [uncultured Tenacibaculum sp.]|uniref:lipopolysaccharide biosynthesis protein n=1 Tax=uncultured Tenacibaculum sp. TaxID=174713 RepID=UPI00262C2866|nr:lipopolysaccharide biosynthesis protein [uncultured Tenacibaculum sp.]